MAVIRPFNPPVVNTTPKPVQTPSQARGAAEARAAQRAFFQQALGDVTPVRTAPQMTAATTSPSATTHDIRRPIPAEPPSRIMRPGSFVDVKV
jgi:hypothetical protein